MASNDKLSVKMFKGSPDKCGRFIINSNDNKKVYGDVNLSDDEVFKARGVLMPNRSNIDFSVEDSNGKSFLKTLRDLDIKRGDLIMIGSTDNMSQYGNEGIYIWDQNGPSSVLYSDARDDKGGIPTSFKVGKTFRPDYWKPYALCSDFYLEDSIVDQIDQNLKLMDAHIDPDEGQVIPWYYKRLYGAEFTMFGQTWLAACVTTHGGFSSSKDGVKIHRIPFDNTRIPERPSMDDLTTCWGFDSEPYINNKVIPEERMIYINYYREYVE